MPGMRLKIRSKKNLIPVLVVVQEEVNQTTILEIMEHSGLVWEKFSILPTVLIISIKISSELKVLADDIVNMNATNTLSTLCHFISNPNKSFTLSHSSITQNISLSCEATTHQMTQ
ncbi:unnamed protein product [Mucor hiemalis]